MSRQPAGLTHGYNTAMELTQEIGRSQKTLRKQYICSSACPSCPEGKCGLRPKIIFSSLVSDAGGFVLVCQNKKKTVID